MTVRPYHLAVIGLLFAAPLSMSQAATHRIASQLDFDRLKTATFQPKDLILFKRGVSFAGMFSPKGQGTREAPIRINAYGQGARPRIDAQGRKKAGLLLHNPSFWEVNELEITNSDGTDDD